MASSYPASKARFDGAVKFVCQVIYNPRNRPLIYSMTVHLRMPRKKHPEFSCNDVKDGREERSCRAFIAGYGHVFPRSIIEAMT